MRINDTHLHLIYPEQFSYAWLAREPALQRPWKVEDYWAEATPLGIEAALHMEVDVAESEMLEESARMLAIHPRVIGAIASARPERPDFSGQLEALAALGGVRGIRRLLQFQSAELSAQPLFVDNVRRLAGYGMTFDLCVKSHELAIAERLARAAPEVQFVLDHCGNPKVADGEWESWAAPMAEIAQLPNVVCKVSGILANVAPGWTVAQLRPYVEHVIALFGWDRVVWGSDHPVVTLFANLTDWVKASREIVASCSTEEQEKLFFRNAERVYRLG